MQRTLVGKGVRTGGGSRQAGIPDWVGHENAAWGLAVTEVNGDAGKLSANLRLEDCLPKYGPQVDIVSGGNLSEASEVPPWKDIQRSSNKLPPWTVELSKQQRPVKPPPPAAGKKKSKEQALLARYKAMKAWGLMREPIRHGAGQA